MMQWLLSSQSLLSTCEIVFSKMMKAGIFWLKQGGLHPASHQHPSLSLRKTQCYVVFDVAHSLSICSSTSTAVVVIFGFASSYHEQAQLILIFFSKTLVDTYPREYNKFALWVVVHNFCSFSSMLMKGQFFQNYLSIESCFIYLCTASNMAQGKGNLKQRTK